MRYSVTPTRGSGHVVFKISRVGSGRVESSQVVFKISRVGSGPVKRRSNLVVRVKSGQVFQISRVGSGKSGHEFFKSHGSSQIGSRGDAKLKGRVRS